MLPSIVDSPIHTLTSSWGDSMKKGKGGGGAENVCNVHFRIIFPHSHGRVPSPFRLNSKLSSIQNSSFHCNFDLTGGVVNGPYQETKIFVRH